MVSSPKCANPNPEQKPVVKMPLNLSDEAQSSAIAVQHITQRERTSFLEDRSFGLIELSV